MNKLFVITAITCAILSNCFAQQQADSAFYSAKQSQWLSKKTGHWNVVMTLQPTVDGKPVTIKSLTAERTMIGAFE